MGTRSLLSYAGLLVHCLSPALASDERQADDSPVKWNPVDKDILAIPGGQAALLNNHIYFVNSTLETHPDFNEPQKYLFKIDLNKQRQLDEFITDAEYSELPSELSNSHAGVLLNDQTRLYAFSEPEDDNESPSKLLAFDTSDQIWQIHDLEGPPLSLRYHENASYTSSPKYGTSFLLKGENEDPGLIKFDASNSNHLAWSSGSADEADTVFIGTKRRNAPVFSLPYGTQGILILLGGTKESGDEANMSFIEIFDVGANRWFGMQIDSAPIPSTRQSFCGWVTAAQDMSQHFITIYGGWNQDEKSPNGEIWVLSIPNFQWTKVRDTTDGIARYYHSCLKLRDDEGLVLGGRVTENGKEPALDPVIEAPLQLLNLSTLEWQDSFDPNANHPYEINDKVIQALGAGADKTGKVAFPPPALASSSADLKSIFEKTIPEPGSQTPTQPGSTPEPSPSGSGELVSVQIEKKGLSKTKKVAIGGAVAAFVMLLAGVVIVCFWLRKKKGKSITDPLIYSKNTSMTMVDDERDGFLPAATTNCETRYQDVVDHSFFKPPQSSRIENWQSQIPSHRSSCSASTVSRTSRTEDFYRSAEKVSVQEIGSQRPRSEVSSAMGTIIVCDGDSPAPSDQRPNVPMPLNSRFGAYREVRSPYQPDRMGSTYF